MSFRLINQPSVRKDIKEVVDYYKNINPALAKQFLLRLKEAKTFIAKEPYAFQLKYKEVRTLLLKQFPYHVHYIIDDKQKLIVILAIIHAHRNPK
jgi:plasmid stabilization system protein ParE